MTGRVKSEWQDPNNIEEHSTIATKSINVDAIQIDSALSHLQVPLLTIGSDGLIQHCNHAASCIFDYSSHELIGQSLFGILPIASMPDLYSFIIPPASCALIEGMNGRKRSGDEVPLNIKLAVWVDEDLGIQHALTLRDITKDLETYRSATKELQRTNNALASLGIGVFDYDINSSELLVSEVYSELMGVRHLDMPEINQAWRVGVHPDDIASTLEMFQECAEGRIEQVSTDYRLRSTDGSHWRWIHAFMSIAKRDEAGRPVRLVGAVTEVTDHKKADHSLRISLSQFRSVFENSPIGKAVLALDGSLTLVNPALCELLGYSEQQLESMGFQDVAHPEELEADLLQFYRMVAGDILYFQEEKRLIRADGSVVWAHISVSTVNTDGDKPDHLIAQVVDITEQRRLHEMKSEFVATVSHELRTPLTSVLGAVDLLSSTISENLPDQAQRLLRIAKGNGDRLKLLIDDILDFEKFSAGKVLLAASPHKISHLVEQAILANTDASKPSAKQYNLVNPAFSLMAWVDPGRFQQVMTNLLTNAAKFSNEDSIVDISLDKRDAFVRVSITNSGEGIPESFRDQVFKPFSQADQSDTRAQGGSGLGLHISKLIVEQTGGEIGYDSVAKGKTTFWFTIPIVRS
jgi:PAS domain S-box-containing protein